MKVREKVRSRKKAVVALVKEAVPASVADATAPVRSRRLAWVSVFLVLALYFWTRLPYYSQPIVNEEGCFAYLISESPKGPYNSMIGRADGHDLLYYFQHPGGQYELYSRVGFVVRGILSAISPAALNGVSWIRFTHSLFQGLLWAALAWCWSQATGTRRIALIAWGLAMGYSLIGLGGSLYLQTDPSSGVLFCGLAALALTRVDSDAKRAWLGPVLAFFALGAVGKQEWSVAASWGLVGGMLVLMVRGEDIHFWKRIIFFSLCALALGNLASLVYDPFDYNAGLAILRGAGRSSTAIHAYNRAQWITLWLWRIEFFGPTMAALMGSTLLAWFAPKGRRGGLLVAVVMAWGLILPFALSTWNGDYRYFTPAWAATLAAGAGVLASRSWKAWHLAVLLVLMGWLGYTHYHLLNKLTVLQSSITEQAGNTVDRDPAAYDNLVLRYKEIYKDPLCVPRGVIGRFWRPGGPDFMGTDVGGKEAMELLAPYHKTLCP